MLTAGTVLPTFFIIGIAFIPVGIALLYFSDEVREHIIDYTPCIQKGTLNTTCAEVIHNNPSDTCICNIDFTLERDFLGKVYMYYGLSNYYQNHRRYVKSRDDDQLLGRLSMQPSTDCVPFETDPDNTKPIAPCGAIANSLFNDTLVIIKQGDPEPVPLLRTGIAWPSDKNIKFRNPEGDLQSGEFFEIVVYKENIDNVLIVALNLINIVISAPIFLAALAGFSKPIAWTKNLWELDPDNAANNGFQVRKRREREKRSEKKNYSKS